MDYSSDSQTQIFGAVQTKAVQIRRRTGKAINVQVNPNRLITNPVPNNEKMKDILFVVYTKHGHDQLLLLYCQEKYLLMYCDHIS